MISLRWDCCQCHSGWHESFPSLGSGLYQKEEVSYIVTNISQSVSLLGIQSQQLPQDHTAVTSPPRQSSDCEPGRQGFSLAWSYQPSTRLQGSTCLPPQRWDYTCALPYQLLMGACSPAVGICVNLVTATHYLYFLCA